MIGCLGFSFQGAGCRVQGSGSRVQGPGFFIQDTGFIASACLRDAVDGECGLVDMTTGSEVVRSLATQLHAFTKLFSRTACNNLGNQG